MQPQVVDEHQLGQYMLRAGAISARRLEEALAIQHELPFLRLGEILLGLKAIAFRDLTDALYRQFSDTMLGQILVRRGFATREQLGEALALQATGDRRKLGELLIEAEVMTRPQLALALEERELYDEYRYRLGFNRYFEDEATEPAPPPGWAQEIAGLEGEGPRWLPG